MRSMGSGNWIRDGKKATVEESLALSVGQFFRQRQVRGSGSCTWTTAIGKTCSIGYEVSLIGIPTIMLHYCWRDSEDVQIAVRLQTTPTQFGGERWWFTCPLIVNGAACNRRAGKLYLPSGARYFGCRKCHALTYRSYQEAHQDERLFAAFGGMEAGWIPSCASGGKMAVFGTAQPGGHLACQAVWSGAGSYLPFTPPGPSRPGN